VASIEDLYTPEPIARSIKGFFAPQPVEHRASKALRNRVNFITSHLFKQLKDHEEALVNTNRLFDQLLDDLDSVCECFREAFTERNIPSSRVFTEIDADRSVGILNILWNTLSYTARGNTKPLALQRTGRPPLFTGRILALHGDFQDVAMELQDQEYPGMLQYEIASLYVPADTTAPAVMTIKHLGDQEHYLHQADAPRMFLLKTIEMVCAGGYFHERDY
jgi:hypothetical protein